MQTYSVSLKQDEGLRKDRSAAFLVSFKTLFQLYRQDIIVNDERERWW